MGERGSQGGRGEGGDAGGGQALSWSWLWGDRIGERVCLHGSRLLVLRDRGSALCLHDC